MATPSLLRLLILLPLVSLAADEADDARRELDELVEEIGRLEKDLGQQVRKRSRSQDRLRTSEKAEAEARQALNEVRRQASEIENSQIALQARTEQADVRLGQQRDRLAEELRRAWVSGREEWLRLMMNQRDPAALGRHMTWLTYVGDQRRAMMLQLGASLSEMSDFRAQLAGQAQQLTDLEEQERSRLDQLSDSRKQRTQALARLDREIADDRARVKSLRAQEQALNELLTELARVTADLSQIPGGKFAGDGATLDWPTDGRVVRRFGQPRAGGQMKWDGVVLEAPAGAEVRAVHGGRVIFSDWLQGMGLLIVLEHSGGYMSLYAHNQDLLRQVGEEVDPGAVIARVGDSGGQDLPGLYFEIRHQGQPVDPASWIH